jgi:hypothetical protein
MAMLEPDMPMGEPSGDERADLLAEIARLRAELEQLRADHAAALEWLAATAAEAERLRAVAEVAREFYAATGGNLGPCTGPHDGTPCYECHVAGEQARAEHEAAEALGTALAAAGMGFGDGALDALDEEVSRG